MKTIRQFNAVDPQTPPVGLTWLGQLGGGLGPPSPLPCLQPHVIPSSPLVEAFAKDSIKGFRQNPRDMVALGPSPQRTIKPHRVLYFINLPKNTPRVSPVPLID